MKATIRRDGPAVDLLILAKWQAPTLAFSTLNDCFGMDRVRGFCLAHGIRITEPKRG